MTNKAKVGLKKVALTGVPAIFFGISGVAGAILTATAFDWEGRAILILLTGLILAGIWLAICGYASEEGWFDDLFVSEEKSEPRPGQWQ